MMKGKWIGDSGITYEYLGSLGRSSVKEVLDNFLERNVPAVIVKNGELAGIEDNTVTLMSRSKCVDESVVEKNHKEYEKRKEVQELLSTNVSDLDDPINNIKARLGEEYSSQIVDSILSSPYDMYLVDFDQRLKKIKNDYYTNRK